MAISEEAVIAIYRYVLGREPESTAVVEHQASAYQTVEDFRRAVIKSEEFYNQYRQLGIPQFPEDKWVRTDIRDGLLIWVNLRDSFVSQGCLRNNWEEPVVDFILSHLQKGHEFIDIGAHIGWFTLITAQRLKLLGGGHVTSFEPRNDLHAMATRSIHENNLQEIVTLHQRTLGDKDSELSLGQAQYNAVVINSPARGGYAGDDHEAGRIVRLDDIPLSGKPGVIRCDAGGAEGLIFKGGQAMLQRHQPLIVTKLDISRLSSASRMTADYFLAWMKAIGYSCFLLADGGTAGHPIQMASDSGDLAANVVFLPRQVVE